ncbi:hypothetical protein CO655_15490 [Rhizobium sp. M1]|nr:hypothetical protein CO655_15490 [Rhizobium sp. M1]
MSQFDLLEARWRWSTASRTIGRLRSLADDLEALADGWLPERSTALMTSWAFATRAAPCLVGHAFGHPSIDDGRRALTSEVYYVDPSRRLARTLSRWYQLGTYDPPEHGTDIVPVKNR